MNTIVRWTIYLAAALAVGPLAGALTGWLRAPDGSGFATPLVSTAPLVGLAAGLLAAMLALAAGFIATRHMGSRAGMLTAGLVLAWAAWRTGTVDQIIRANDSGAVLWRLAAEGAIFGAVAVALSFALQVVERLEREDSPVNAGASAPGRWRASAAPVAAGVLAGAVAAWFVAQTPLKGQTIAAAIISSVFGAAAARLVDVRAPLATLAVPVAVLAVLGPLSGVVVGASPTVLVAGRNGTLFPLANILPLDWIAGGMLGIPLGVAWASSLIDKRTESVQG